MTITKPIETQHLIKLVKTWESTDPDTHLAQLLRELLDRRNEEVRRAMWLHETQRLFQKLRAHLFGTSPGWSLIVGELETAVERISGMALEHPLDQQPSDPSCHACGARPAPARGPYGELCDPCWTRTVAIVRRILGKPDDWWPGAESGAETR